MVEERVAEFGMVWKSKKDGAILNEILILGVFDDISNYEQIPKPVEVENE